MNFGKNLLHWSEFMASEIFQSNYTTELVSSISAGLLVTLSNNLANLMERQEAEYEN